MMNDIEKAIDILNQDICYIGHRFTRDEYDKAVQTAIAAIEAQQADRWIPISDETNPKESDIYLLTFEENGNRYVERFYYSRINGWMMPVYWQDEGHIDKLIAWKSLPEPYKEQK